MFTFKKKFLLNSLDLHSHVTQGRIAPPAQKRHSQFKGMTQKHEILLRDIQLGKFGPNRSVAGLACPPREWEENRRADTVLNSLLEARIFEGLSFHTA